MSAQLDAMRSFMLTRSAVGTAAAPAPRAEAGPQVVVVGSGKGGAGTSVVAALVALAAASTGRRVLLVDADEHVGPQRYLLGVAPAPAIADLRGGVDVGALPVAVSATLSLVSGGPGVTGAAAAEPAERRALLRRVTALYPGHDLVVVDGGSRLDTVCACCDALGGSATRLLVVAGTDPVSLAAAYALMKAARGGSDAAPARSPATDVVVNRHDETAARHGFAQIEQACLEFLGAAVRLAGILPDDTCLEAALRAGMPLQDAAAGSPAAVAAQALVDGLLDDLAGGGSRPAPRSAASNAASNAASGYSSAARPANPYASSPLLARAGALR
ncbi:MAG: hypothetical protein JO180_12020 [Gemmatirosa sp.]|nr:hypothetical protein [Gemmatirosa sp.]